MAEALQLTNEIEIPASELTVRVSRSGGPGGQHANVTDSRVEMTFDIEASPSLPEWARTRLLERLGPRAVAVAADERSQLRNREIARERLEQRLRQALKRPTPRRATRPSAAERERRLDEKRRQGERKRARRPPSEE